MNWLKQSTAATIKLGPFLDDSDGKTAETGLTISQADIRVSKNGGAFAQSNNAAGATHDENGWYGIPLDATDTGTLGRLAVAIHESGALPVWAEFLVVPANVYDSLVSGSDELEVDAASVGGTAQTGRDLGAGVLLSPGTGAGQVSLASGKVTAGTVDDKTGYALHGDYDAAKTAAAAGAQMDLVDAPNATAVTAIADALSAGDAAAVVTALLARTGWTAGGTASVQTLLRCLFSMAAGKFSKSGDAYTFYDVDDPGTALYTVTVADDGRTAEMA